MMTQTLIIKDYALWIHLGVTEQEQYKPQQVLLTLKIDFQNNLKACDTDEIQDTLCYDQITTKISQMLQNKKFKTIEYLAKKIYEHTKPQILIQNQLTVEVHKVSPPMPNILGGTRFIYGDAHS